MPLGDHWYDFNTSGFSRLVYSVMSFLAIQAIYSALIFFDRIWKYRYLIELWEHPVQMDSHSDHSKLDCLPIELLRIIVLCVSERGSLKSLSRVNRLLRQLCVPFLFQTLQVGFSIPELDRLLRVAKSQFAPYVRALSYQASALVDPRKCLASSLYRG
jgi:hypothetical protein